MCIALRGTRTTTSAHGGVRSGRCSAHSAFVYVYTAWNATRAFPPSLPVTVVSPFALWRCLDSASHPGLPRPDCYLLGLFCAAFASTISSDAIEIQSHRTTGSTCLLFSCTQKGAREARGSGSWPLCRRQRKPPMNGTPPRVVRRAGRCAAPAARRRERLPARSRQARPCKGFVPVGHDAAQVSAHGTLRHSSRSCHRARRAQGAAGWRQRPDQAPRLLVASASRAVLLSRWVIAGSFTAPATARASWRAADGRAELDCAHVRAAILLAESRSALQMTCERAASTGSLV